MPRLRLVRSSLPVGERIATANAMAVHRAEAAGSGTTSESFTFSVNIGPAEGPTWLDDLRWHLEQFHLWPTGPFKDRADRIAGQLPHWGQLLYREAIANDSARHAARVWMDAGEFSERRFSVIVERTAATDASDADMRASREGSAVLSSLPRELLHDGRGYLFQGRNAVRVRRLSHSRRGHSFNAAQLSE